MIMDRSQIVIHDKGEGGVKNWPKIDDIICEWSLIVMNELIYTFPQ